MIQGAAPKEPKFRGRSYAMHLGDPMIPDTEVPAISCALRVGPVSDAEGRVAHSRAAGPWTKVTPTDEDRGQRNGPLGNRVGSFSLGGTSALVPLSN